jgi:hypothetical protein
MKKSKGKITVKKCNIYEPVSIEDAINCFQTFLECDLWSKFKDAKIKGKIWVRKDKFKTEEELWDYLNGHLNILRKEMKGFQGKLKEEIHNRYFTDYNDKIKVRHWIDKIFGDIWVRN